MSERIKKKGNRGVMNDPTTPQTIMRALLTDGLIFEPKSGFYKVVIS